MTTTPLDPALKRRLEDAGQDHLLRFWSELDEPGRARLAAQLAALDLEQVAELGELLRADAGAAGSVALEPPELFPLERDAALRARADEARDVGRGMLAAGRVGYVLVAGGQASRLGYRGPKGAFPIGPVSDRTLFEFHARRLVAARERHGAAPVWYVMTSAANDAETKRFFRERDWLGLGEDQVFFFGQEMLPALDERGRILMAARDSLFLAPNGHGGVLLGLAASGALDHMRERGIDTISYFQVDNPLARPADPLFLGLHELEGARMSTKVVAKRHAGEKVGVIGRIDGAMGCIEYSDLPDELREARNASGALLFRAGNIALHAIEADFVRELCAHGLELPWHLARKKMKVVDEHGRPVEALGTKFESFVFDALSRSPRSVTLEVDRAREFSPVKNSEGEDSPASARRDLCALFADWVRRAGLELPEAGPEGVHPVEVDPVLAEDAEEFLASGRPDPAVTERGHLYE